MIRPSGSHTGGSKRHDIPSTSDTRHRRYPCDRNHNHKTNTSRYPSYTPQDRVEGATRKEGKRKYKCHHGESHPQSPLLDYDE